MGPALRCPDFFADLIMHKYAVLVATDYDDQKGK